MAAENNDTFLKPTASTPQDTRDAFDLAGLGHGQAMVRKFSLWSMSALAFCVLGTWAAIASSLQTGLSNGGPISVLWGLLLITACNLCLAVSLGELCSSMPTALGQAYYVYKLCESETGRLLSYLCAWTNIFGWWTASASLLAFNTNFIIGLKLLYEPEWDGANQPWVSFLIYLSLSVFVTGFNAMGCRKDQVLPWLNNIMGGLFAALFLVFSAALIIAVATSDRLVFRRPGFVFATWFNETGWPDGIVWFLGLLQSSYGLTAFDSVIHMIEEVPDPRRNGPKAIYLAVLTGAFTGFFFMMICLFSMQDIEKVTNSPTGLPFIGLIHEVMGKDGAAALIAIFTFNTIGQNVSVATTASRMTWGFARDGGLPWSTYLSKVDPAWKAPVRAIWTQGILTALIGVLYLFSTTVLTAIVSVSTVALMISYGLPISVLLIVGRDRLCPGPFRLGKLGTPLNYVGIVTCVVTTVFFFFPSNPNPSGSDMNYAIAVFGIMVVVSVGFWFLRGYRTYMRTEEVDQDIIVAQQQPEEISRQNSIAKRE
ncbi:hypothetical protein QQS21_000956 [Conoideocrella luteorostrata]|uniref:Choline transport protein n=1 Tax=Conoideocrella luteorostrata TaxID=1105319 RepID=A0AAJ0D179_9HYPO|nr:hypothetical protein QQS21_000956 [Conoideocrella luteorostrata]